MIYSYTLPRCLNQRFSLLSASVTVSVLTLSGFLSPVLAQKAAPPPVVVQNSSGVETDYTLGAGDRIRVDIFQVPDISREYLVLVDGTVGFPLIGTIEVEGLSTAQLAELLTQRYSAFIKRPLVTIGLVAPRPLTIAVSGEINSPGSYNLPVDGGKFPSVTDLIEKAGGLTAAADVSKVQVRRTLQDRQQTFSLNLWNLYYEGDRGQNITLRDGDSLLIPSAGEINAYNVSQLVDANFGINANQEIDVAIVGEVYRPGTYKLSAEGTSSSVSNTGVARRRPPTITRAITTAGGIKPLADVRNVQLRRLTRLGERQEIDVDLWKLLEEGAIEQDLVLREGDTIIVPTAKDLPADKSQTLAEASFAPATIRVTVVGEVVSPGVRELPPNIPLNQAIAASGSFDKQRADEATVELIRLNPNGTVTKQELAVDFSQGVGSKNNPPLRDKDVIVVRRNALTTATDFLNTLFNPLGAILNPAARVSGFINVFD